MEEKEIVWLKNDFETSPFSGSVRIQAVVYLKKIQNGEIPAMPICCPMPKIGRNCHELRIRDFERRIEWRIVFHICLDAIVILDVFEKKINKTPLLVVTKCRKSLRFFYESIEKNYYNG